MSVTTTTVTINSNDLGTTATLVLVFDVDNGTPKHAPYKDFYPVVIRVGTFLDQGNYAISLRYVNQLSFVKPGNVLRRPGPGDGDPEDTGKGDGDDSATWTDINSGQVTTLSQSGGTDDDDSATWIDINPGDSDLEGTGKGDGDDDDSATWIDINPGQVTTLSQSGGTYTFSKPNTIDPPQPAVIRAVNSSSLREDIVVGYQNPKGAGLLPQSTWSFSNISVGSNVTTEFTPILQAYVADGYTDNQVVREPFQESPIWTQDLSELGNTTDFRLTWAPSTGVFSITQVVSAPPCSAL